MKNINCVICYLLCSLIILNGCATRLLSTSYNEKEISQFNKYRIEAIQDGSNFKIKIIKEIWTSRQKEKVEEYEHAKATGIVYFGSIVLAPIMLPLLIIIAAKDRFWVDDAWVKSKSEKIIPLEKYEKLISSLPINSCSVQVLFKNSSGKFILKEETTNNNDGSYTIQIPFKEVLSSITKNDNCVARIEIVSKDKQLSNLTQEKELIYNDLLSAYEKLIPPSLITTASFSDDASVIPNNTIDALESSQIAIKVKNSGQGLASSVQLSVESNNPLIKIENFDSNIGDLRLDETKSVVVPIKADVSIKSGSADIIVKTKEKNDFDAQPVKLVVSTEAMQPPKLAITKIEMKDAGGLAQGNGDGLVGTGETIELTAYVRNDGVGKSVNPTLSLKSISDGIEKVEATSLLGDIPINKTSTGKVVFRVPKNYNKEKITYILSASDPRNIGTGEKSEEVNITKQNAQLTYSLIQGNTFSNNASNTMQLSLENTGKLDATNVRIELSSNESGVTIGTPITNLGSISASTKTQTIAIPFFLSRTYSNKNASFSLKISQDDFPSLVETVKLPINTIKPLIKINDAIVDENGNGKIEQGERIKLQLSLTNTGKLSAENVSIKLLTPTSVKFFSDTKKFIGQIPSGVTSDLWPIEFLVPGGTTTGDFPLEVIITEKDFSIPIDTLKYLISNRGENVVVVKGKNDNQSNFSYAGTSTKPILSVSSVANLQTIYSLPLDIGGSASADKGIQFVSFKINGKQIYDSRNDLSAADKLQKTQGKLLDFKTSLLQLNVGNNDLEISVFDKENEFTTQKISLIYSPDKNLVSGLNPSVDVDNVDKLDVNAINPNYYAVIFGIDKYQKIPAANYADKDAIAFREYATRVLGVEENNIYFKINESATKSEFDKAFGIGGWLHKRVKNNPNAEIIIFFSGHGAPDDDTKEAYILPFDVDDDYLVQTSTSLSWLYENLSKMTVKHASVFVDACFSGFSLRGGFKENIFAQQKGVKVRPKTPIVFNNMTVFTASKEDQSSTTYPEKQHGLFSYYLLKALGTKEADQDRDGSISSDELFNYMLKNVENMSSKLDKYQTPTLWGDKDFIVLRK